MMAIKKINQILLIDDDQTNNYLNEELLKEMDIAHHIEVLLNGKKALNYLEANCLKVNKGNCPAIVIFDHFMPVMDGLEMIQALQKKGFMNQTDVIFMLLGIHTNKADIETFQRLGVQEFTTKSLSQQTVMEAYNKYWGEKPAKSLA